jgi:hypothetical protein
MRGEPGTVIVDVTAPPAAGIVLGTSVLVYVVHPTLGAAGWMLTLRP